MLEKETERLVVELLNKGHSLAHVQKILDDEYNTKITYMELRLIASEQAIDWEQHDSKTAQSDKRLNLGVTDARQNESENKLEKTSVTLDRILRPGAVMSGNVHFSSGKTAEWQVDQLGRLSLNPTGASEKPSPQELQEFQLALQEKMQGPR